jgi:undecaprenyl-diphosphatase
MEFLVALPLLVKAGILGVVEGLTEFLPISSTGHLILAGALLGWTDDKAKLFDVAIQTGAMFAILWYFRERIFGVIKGIGWDPIAQRFARNMVIACLPAIVLGLLFGKIIKAYLFKPVPVAIAFIVGGFIILWVEKRQSAGKRPPRVDNIDDLTALDAFKLGVAQCAALIPGTSRSGATIIGGLLFGLSRRTATEFSFFMAIPILMGAGAYDTYKYRHLLTSADIPLFAVGLVSAFISALIVVRWLIQFVSRKDFTGFAWYRIFFGALVLLTGHFGWVNWAH